MINSFIRNASAPERPKPSSINLPMPPKSKRPKNIPRRKPSMKTKKGGKKKSNKTAGTKRKIKKPSKYEDNYENTRKTINKNKKDLKDFERKINNRGLKLSDIKDIDLPTMDVEVGGKSLGKDIDKAISTGVGVAQDIGRVGMSVGKSVGRDVKSVGRMGIGDVESVGRMGIGDVESVGKRVMKMLTMKRGKSCRLYTSPSLRD